MVIKLICRWASCFRIIRQTSWGPETIQSKYPRSRRSRRSRVQEDQSTETSHLVGKGRWCGVLDITAPHSTFNVALGAAVRKNQSAR